MLHALSILLSSFLLFQVQLILGKFLLPWFGGTPSVWTTCMLFFQTMLLAGYAYAFAIDRLCAPRKQQIIHLSLLGVGIASVFLAYHFKGSPILPELTSKPAFGSNSPIGDILKLLLISIGVPFLLLAANSPLLQRWYHLNNNAQPYRLYALSNVGSLLGLISYPFLIEPTIGLQHQSLIWTGLFLVFCILTAACAFKLRNSPQHTQRATPLETTRARPRPLNTRFTLLLAGCPACLLLAVTNDLCQEVAVVPFLWVLPLAIYLLSFIICFDRAQWYRRAFWLPFAYGCTIVVLITSLKGIHLDLISHILSYCAFLFSISMVCHGELYRIRPDAQKLTAFYLLVATGGVIGSALVALIAPLYFKGYWEFTAAVLVTWLSLGWLYWKDTSSALHTGNRWHYYLLVLLVSYIGLHYAMYYSGLNPHSFIIQHKEPINLLAAFALATSLCILLRKRAFIAKPIWPRLLLGCILFISECFAIFDVRRSSEDSIFMDRNFYGTLRVIEKTSTSKNADARSRQLIHGNIVHGEQSLNPAHEFVPTSYYNNSSGLGKAIQQHPKRIANQPIKVGVTGLGVGAICAHLNAGDEALFFEINPMVIDLAYGPDALFSYLNESPAKVNVLAGDARVTLEHLLQTEGSLGFDVLALDAFTSDAVPTHLLTIEAFETYLAHLRDQDSIIAVNISNRFLALEAPVWNAAKHYGLSAAIIYSIGEAPHPTLSNWILLTQNSEFFGTLEHGLTGFERPYAPESDILWTDDYSNLLRVIKR